MRAVSLRKNQQGIVSFFVVIIIMIVLTLIVLAFAQLVRREQRQTLDRQLKTQALYAAESGVNDALDWLADPANQGNLFTSWNDECEGPGSFIDVALNDNNTLDPDGVVSYSCLLVDPAPAELAYTVPTDESAIFKLQPESSSIGRLEITWQDNAGGGDVTCSNSVGSYPGDGNQSCTIGNIRLEIVPFNLAAAGPPPNRSDLINDRFIAIAQPGSAGSVEWDDSTLRAQGQSVAASCSAGVCRLSITDIPGITLGYMRIGSIYRASDITVEAYAGAGGTPLSMIGAQVEVDATGKANDVLHRVKVNAPIAIEGGGPAPEFALLSRLTQCKRFAVPGGDPVLFPGDPDTQRCSPYQPVTDPN